MCIRDSGIGMEKSFLKKIFEPFEQDSQQRSNQGGSGLGLSIAEKYARLMNGGIAVDSAPGQGSTFVARIWLENDEAQAPVSLEERFRHLKALVVDADAEELEYTCSLLFRFGVAAEGFASGDMALERLDAAVRQGESDIIVLVDWGNARPAADALIRQIRKSVCLLYTSSQPSRAARALQSAGWSGRLPLRSGGVSLSMLRRSCRPESSAN